MILSRISSPPSGVVQFQKEGERSIQSHHLKLLPHHIQSGLLRSGSVTVLTYILGNRARKNWFVSTTKLDSVTKNRLSLRARITFLEEAVMHSSSWPRLLIVSARLAVTCFL